MLQDSGRQCIITAISNMYIWVSIPQNNKANVYDVDWRWLQR